ncbi:SDR family oxidoreductase [Pantoea sp. A4]|uniref:SDR family oxidoreductase n=1 Tax=Pantoea sp. A4 TaxID=1225184 RepID=UPI00035F4F54|nr:SDR family oxidoreductase [Pantoea sp. A4]
MGRFTGKRVLITGGTRGIGLAGALRVIREGGQAIVTGRNVDRVLTAKAGLPSVLQVVRNDASDCSTGQALAEAVSAHGKLDGVWFNAGFARLNTLEQTDATTFDEMMSANVRGPMLQLAALMPLFNPGASVVVTSSSSAYEGAAQTSIYAATKAALLGLVRCWATELGPKNIRVNAIIPGPIQTPFRDFLPAAQRAEFEAGVVNQLALDCMGTPEQAAAVALFLLSDEAAFVTGSEYSVDGGLLLR